MLVRLEGPIAELHQRGIADTLLSEFFHDQVALGCIEGNNADRKAVSPRFQKPDHLIRDALRLSLSDSACATALILALRCRHINPLANSVTIISSQRTKTGEKCFGKCKFIGTAKGVNLAQANRFIKLFADKLTE